MAATVKYPDALVTVFRTSPVASFFTTTVASGMTEPEASETVPVRVPEMVWANPITLRSKQPATARYRGAVFLKSNMDFSPFSVEPLSQDCKGVYALGLEVTRLKRL